MNRRVLVVCVAGTLCTASIAVAGEDAAARTAYRGSIYRTNPDIEVPMDIQEALAGRLSELDLAPQQRLEHFSWCRRPDLAITGWSGTIRDVRRTPGGFVVEIRVNPRLEKLDQVATATLDSHIERYRIDQASRVRYLGGNAPPGPRRRGLIGF